MMMFRPQEISNSIHCVGSKRNERNSYALMSDNALNRKDMCLTLNSY